MSEEDLLKAGISAAKLGNMAQAASLFAQTVKQHPTSERGWFFLGMSCSTPEQRKYCLNRVLTLNPNNMEAIKQLAILSKSVSQPSTVSPSTPKPPVSTAITRNREQDNNSKSATSAFERTNTTKINDFRNDMVSTPSRKVDDIVLREIEEKRKSSQAETSTGLVLGIGGGCLSATIAATIWAAIAYVTHYQFSLIAIGVGLIVGYTMKVLNKNGSFYSGIIAALLAAFGCFLGNYLAVSALISTRVSVPILVVAIKLITNPQALAEVAGILFGPKELLFYVIAMFASFKTSV
jgi:hypothetical protein